MTGKQLMILFISLTAIVIGGAVLGEKYSGRDKIEYLEQQVRDLSEKTCPAPTEEDCRRVYGVKLPENIKLSGKDTFIDPDGEQLPELNTVAMYKGRKCTVVQEYRDSPHCVVCVGDIRSKPYIPGVSDPFEDKADRESVIIDDIREGWVKFRFGKGAVFKESRGATLKVVTLCAVYTELEK